MTIYQDWPNRLIHQKKKKKKKKKNRAGLIFPTYLYRKLKKSSCQKPLEQFLYNLSEMFLWWPSIKIVQAIIICQNTRPPRGGIELLSLYICMENFLVRNHWTDFNIIWQKCSFGDTLQRRFKPTWLVKKHYRWGTLLYLPVYLYKNFNYLLVWNSLTNFNIIWQKCSFSDINEILLKKMLSLLPLGMVFGYFT